ncbi:hypothetical protein ACVNF4_25755 [Streptomyces sp. S6]
MHDFTDLHGIRAPGVVLPSTRLTGMSAYLTGADLTGVRGTTPAAVGEVVGTDGATRC